MGYKTALDYLMGKEKKTDWFKFGRDTASGIAGTGRLRFTEADIPEIRNQNLGDISDVAYRWIANLVDTKEWKNEVGKYIQKEATSFEERLEIEGAWKDGYVSYMAERI